MNLSMAVPRDLFRRRIWGVQMGVPHPCLVWREKRQERLSEYHGYYVSESDGHSLL